MQRLSTARQFFDGLIAGGSPAIEALVSSQQHETEWLDFKAGDSLGDDKSTWSEALCGFANNQGGVLIWGVDARKDSTGVDAACDLRPVANPSALRTRLLELLRTALEPPLAGVEVRDLLQANLTCGFVVCFIPESNSKPHRAENLPGKPYKIRIADAFINPSPSLLRSLFFPQSSPQLQVEVDPKWSAVMTEPREHSVFFDVAIRNVGIVSAKDVHLMLFTFPTALEIRVVPYAEKTREETANAISLFKPIHPMTRSVVCSVVCPTQVNRVGDGHGPYQFLPKLRIFAAKFNMFAADMLPLSLSVEFRQADIDSRRVKVGEPHLGEWSVTIFDE